MKRSEDEHDKLFPVLTNDDEAEDFLAQDLSTLDFAQFKPMRLKRCPNLPA